MQLVGVVVGKQRGDREPLRTSAIAAVPLSAHAPAASVGPSMPSVPTLLSSIGRSSRDERIDGTRDELLVATATARAGHGHGRLAAADDAERSPAIGRRVAQRRHVRGAGVARLAEHRRRQ